MNESAYPLKIILQPMKPCKIDPRNDNQVVKLNKCLASEEYIAEEKIDGCSYFLQGDRFFSTHVSEKTGFPVEKTDNFPHLRDVFKFLNESQIILSGEIFYEGKRSQDVTPVTGAHAETAIQYQEKNGWVEYKIHDILRNTKGEWLLDKPWRVRREELESLSTRFIKLSNNIELSKVQWNNKGDFVKQLIEDGREGAVLKHINGLYYAGKRPMWNQIKVKQTLEDDAIIIGFEDPEKYYTGKDVHTWKYWDEIEKEPVTKYHKLGWIGSITLGKYDSNGKIKEVGSVSGMTDSIRLDISNNKSKYLGKVAHVKMMEKTNDGNYRHASFVQIHQDKNASECIIE